MRGELEDFLLLRSKEEWDYKWAIEFESWDRGDCSYHYLLTVALMREYELSDNGIFGTHDDVKDSIRQLNEFAIEGRMINYCVDYFYVDDDFYEGDTFIFSSNEDRQTWIDKADDHYSILDVYENEDCYCHAYDEGECACGNFK